jgi:hypothetical protein
MGQLFVASMTVAIMATPLLVDAASPAFAVPAHSVTMPNVGVRGHVYFSVRPAGFVSGFGYYHYRFLRWSHWTTWAQAEGQQHLHCIGAGHCIPNAPGGWSNLAVTITLSRPREGRFTRMKLYYHAAHVSVPEQFYYRGQLVGWFPVV